MDKTVVTVAKEKLLISLLKIYKKRSPFPLSFFRPTANHRGLTLIEVMIVVVIIAGMAVIAIPRINNQNNQMKAAVRRLSVLSRQLRNLAKLNNATYRLVVDLGEGAESNKEQFYWAEKSTKAFRIAKNMEKKIELRREQERRLEGMSEEERKKAEAELSDGFSVDTTVFKQKQSLPGRLRFSGVEQIGLDDELKEGKIFVHYLPAGLVQETALHLLITGTKMEWTLVIHPITGKMDIITERQTLKEIRRQK